MALLNIQDEFEPATKRVSDVIQSMTPLTLISSQRTGQGTGHVYCKQEQATDVSSFKLRGAYNKMARLQEENSQIDRVVAASAGNHAQGVALSAKKLGLHATIFMPETAPQTKIDAVKTHGGDNVSIELVGNNFDATSKEAQKHATESDHIFVHPFDDIYTIAGQSTIATEIIEQTRRNPIDIAFVQIGGGGLAAGVAARMKENNPNVVIVGVEGIGQASMDASIKAGKPVEIQKLDIFCDGTAVRRPGDLTFELCKTHLDSIITVSNQEVCASVKSIWETMQKIAEPSGAMGYAGLQKFVRDNPNDVEGKNLLWILSGGNVDFVKLGSIGEQAAIGAHEKQFLRFQIEERPGSLLSLANQYMNGIDITDFLHGMSNTDTAYPVIGFGAPPERLERLIEDLRRDNVPFDNVIEDESVQIRNIPYAPDLIQDSFFYRVDFDEKIGALRKILSEIQEVSGITYFNYKYTGESIGRALMGFKTDNKEELERKLQIYTRGYEPVSSTAEASLKNKDIVCLSPT